jgi:DNA-binding NtrC family response regulator
LKAFKTWCYIEIILPKWQPAISNALFGPIPLTLSLRMKENILLIGCDIASQQLITNELKQAGYQINTSANSTDFEQFLAKSHPDLILLNYPIHSSYSKLLIKQWATEYPFLMLLSDESDLEQVSLGAVEFLLKPIDTKELLLAVRRIIDNALLYMRGDFYINSVHQETPSLLVGNSAAMLHLLSEIKAVASTQATVLILGESGCGKEMVAQEIHRLSDRSSKQLVAVDCCSLQESLFESELFGHERGAFTGALQKKIGLIEHAGGSTLFLDEIGEIPPAIQAKLLRVLETKRFRRVGGTVDIESDVRIVAATNKDLHEMAQRGEFRLDLLYRLNAFVITTPTLRERREDIPALSDYFLSHLNFSKRITKRISVSAQPHHLKISQALRYP